ncbi:acetate/propionate family kinase [Granulicella tundricola]|uniref:Acetate kinase n=1 Tax=Granulicella tundricola (strain ATCC BAA-1859 / DSM 23138 / MP5ACTX9) TaxID=1198114 RepID=E8WYB2_GRATM|nr:acetate kinase [Granulicella tundricola]ADW68739.1 acetate kinase [Granulicella tundricola MP5ACTX9]
MLILVLNSGSSSLKFSVFDSERSDEPILQGELHGPALDCVDQVFTRVADLTLDAIGYRVVHPGPKLDRHQRITPEVLQALDAASGFAPLHDPEAVSIIRGGLARYPQLPHFACFDTIFHQTMPTEANTYPIPKSYRDAGVRRYGFHGLACESVVNQLQQTGVPKRLIIAHLGSGCSVTAVVEGRSIDTSMGLTPTGGVVMGTRPGDLDPDLILHLIRQVGGDVEKVEKDLNHASGLAALSGLPNDMKAIRKAAQAGNGDAVLALKVFTRSVRKSIGAYSWLMGGVDAIAFSGGIGEHDAASREEILVELAEQGIEIDSALNNAEQNGMRRVNAPGSNTGIFIVPAQEDLMIANHVKRMMIEETYDDDRRFC